MKTTDATRNIGMLIVNGSQSMDAIGPLEVFGMADRQLKDDGVQTTDAYRSVVLSMASGPVSMAFGLQIHADYGFDDAIPELDTLLVAGGTDTAIAHACANQSLLSWLQQQQSSLRRVGSVCNGALILAEAGVLDNRKATTHWLDARQLSQRMGVEVEDDAIYIKDQNVWTSAGVTAGMDLALAMVAEDFGRALALRVAKRMILFMHRAGGQHQYSTALAGQMTSDRLSPVLEWLQSHYHQPIRIAAVAERFHISSRNLARWFQQELGVTPLQYLKNLRLEAAKALLESSRKTLTRIASASGFSSATALRNSFVQAIGTTPAEYRKRFGVDRIPE